MKNKFILIVLSFISILLVIIGVYYLNFRITSNTYLYNSDINKIITHNYKNLEDVKIGEQVVLHNSIYTIYSFKDSKLLNSNLNQYNVGICSITNIKKVQTVGNNVFTTYDNEDDEEVVRLKNVFTQVGFYDKNTDRCIIGGYVSDSRIKKIEIEFINGEIKQPVINEKGYFIFIYNQNKVIKDKKSFYTYTDVIKSIIAYDVNDKKLREISFRQNSK